MALVAEEEAKAISARTMAALAASKARGRKLGGWRGGPVVDQSQGAAAIMQNADTFAGTIRPMVIAMQAEGVSLRGIAARLTARG